jgi:CubicO group peptidase (beta-lactamase class C family)
VAVASALLGVAGLAAQEPRHRSDFLIMTATKVLCSAVFVSERDPVEAFWNSVFPSVPRIDGHLTHARRGDRTELRYQLDQAMVARMRGGRLDSLDQATVTMEVDHRAGRATGSIAGFTARARSFGDQGCTLLPSGHDSVFFAPVRTRLPKDRWDHPVAAAEERLRPAVDSAFHPDALTAGFLVVHRGRIVAERYGAGAGPATQLESWSMGKSLTATLIGVLAQEGALRLDEPAPVPLWRLDPSDPRAAITVADLLRMSGGLRFTAARQPAHLWGREESDHSYVYSGAIDVFQLSITRPAEFPPGTVGRYLNSDPLTLGAIARRIVEARGERYLAWPTAAVFAPLGIGRQVLEPDPYGNLILTGYDYGTARGWARLGMLYLGDGVFEGRRILPEGFVRFVRSPAPAWSQPIYGGLFWLNGDCAPDATGVYGCRDRAHPSSRPEYQHRRWNLPSSAFYMDGAGGQKTIVVPSHDLVVVRLGHRRGADGPAGDAAHRALNVALGLLMEVVPPSDAGSDGDR